MNLLDRLFRRNQPRAVQAVQVVQVSQPAPVVDKTIRRVCRWCGIAHPIADVDLDTLCPACQHVRDRRDASIARMRARS